MNLFDLWYDTFFNEEEIKKLNKEINKVRVLKKTRNSAPKFIKGDYDLSIHGNKILLVDNIEGISVEAKCSPEDNFDIGEGIKEAFKKMNAKREEIRKEKEDKNEIKIGDWVQVINNGQSYTTYPDGLIGRVIVIGNHEKDKSQKMIGLEAEDGVYIINIEGVKKVKAPNE